MDMFEAFGKAIGFFIGLALILILGALFWGTVTYLLWLLISLAFEVPEITWYPQSLVVGMVITIIMILFSRSNKNG